MDIVKRLKEQSGWSERTANMGRTSEMLWDAINEIKRLRTVMKAAFANFEDDDESSAYMTLRGGIEHSHKGCK